MATMMAGDTPAYGIGGAFDPKGFRPGMAWKATRDLANPMMGRSENGDTMARSLWGTQPYANPSRYGVFAGPGADSAPRMHDEAAPAGGRTRASRPGHDDAPSSSPAVYDQYGLDADDAVRSYARPGTAGTYDPLEHQNETFASTFPARAATGMGPGGSGGRNFGTSLTASIPEGGKRLVNRVPNFDNAVGTSVTARPTGVPIFMGKGRGR